jgi:hypothetical protein
MKKASSLGGFGSLNELYEDAKLGWPHQARESVFGPYHHHYQWKAQACRLHLFVRTVK